MDERPVDAGRRRLPGRVNRHKQSEPECAGRFFDLVVGIDSVRCAIRVIAKSEVLQLQSNNGSGNEHDHNYVRVANTSDGLGFCSWRC